MTTATLFPLEMQPPGTSPAPNGRARARRACEVPDDPVGTHRRGPGSVRPAAQVAAIPVHAALARPGSSSTRWFDWSADPYLRGASGGGGGSPHGTREMPPFGTRARLAVPPGGGPGDRSARLGPDAARESEEPIHVVEGFAAALRRDLRSRVRPGEHVAFGTATDPYEPIERREGVMRASLGVLARESGLRISITTRSNLVLRDADLLREVARRNDLQVNVAVATPDRRLGRLLEPGAPPPALRLATLRALRRSGLRAGVLLAPVLPGVTDAAPDLSALFRAAREAGALFVAHRTVLLEGAARARLLGLLRRGYPRVAARFEVWTLARGPAPEDVGAEVERRISALARASGLAELPPGSAGLPAPRRSAPILQRSFRFAGEGA